MSNFFKKEFYFHTDAPIEWKFAKVKTQEKSQEALSKHKLEANCSWSGENSLLTISSKKRKKEEAIVFNSPEGILFTFLAANNTEKFRAMGKAQFTIIFVFFENETMS